MRKSAKTERKTGKGAKASTKKAPPAPKKPAAPAARPRTAARYEPPPLQSDGWAPFRYPPQ